MKYILKFENYTAPISKGAEIEQIYDEGGTLQDKSISKEITPEQKEVLEKGEKETENNSGVKINRACKNLLKAGAK